MLGQHPLLTKFFQQIFQDIDGAYSSKRVVVYAAMICLIAAFIVNLSAGVVVANFMWDSMVYIVIGGIGITSLTERGIPFTSQTAKKLEVTRTEDKSLTVEAAVDETKIKK